MDFPASQHPIITAMEKTGYPDSKEPQYPHCPICGQECETIYRDADYEIVGCDECIRKDDAWEEEDCFPEKSFSF